MSWSGVMDLAQRDLRASRGRSAISLAGIAVGIWVLTLIVALGLGTRNVVLKEVVRELPVDIVEVIPKTLDLGLFKMGAGSLFGGQTLGPDIEERLRALPEVAGVYPKIEIKLPLGAQGGTRFFGRALYTDLFMTAIPPELVEGEGLSGFTDQPGIVPVLLSDQLIELYNASVAPTLGAPQLTSQTLVGFQFDIVIGRSLMMGDRGARTTGIERGEIVGTSRYAMTLGVTVPLATGKRLLERYALPGTTPHDSSILVRARSPADVPSIAQAVESWGFAIDQTADKTRHLLTAGTALASGVGLLVLLLAALNIAHSFIAMLSERRRELAVLRAVGARRGHLLALILLQAAALGLAGGIVGLAMARLGAMGIDAAAARWLPNFPFKPVTFFEFPAWLTAASLSAGLTAATLGALVPAWRAARSPICRNL